MKLKRKLYILKCRTYVLLRHLAEKVLLHFAEWKLIKCHKNTYSRVLDESTPQSAPDFTSDRFIFSVSYILRKFEFVYEYWFETKKGKRIFIVEDTRHVEERVSYRAELKAFLAHFSPRQRMWVYSTSPVVQVFDSKGYFQDLSKGIVSQFKVNTHQCDFSQCRYAFEFSYAPEMNKLGRPYEVISESYRVFGNQLTSKIPEINKILTGADYDGEMMSPKKMPLCENILCSKCGLPVFASSEDKYKFECLKHGELEVFNVRRVDPFNYEGVLENTLEILEDLIAESCPQDSNL